MSTPANCPNCGAALKHPSIPLLPYRWQYACGTVDAPAGTARQRSGLCVRRQAEQAAEEIKRRNAAADRSKV